MEANRLPHIDLNRVPSPCYLCDIGALEENLRLLNAIQERTGCRILMALKGFAMFSVFHLVRRYLSGAAASSLNEARLAREEVGGEVHVYAPAFKEEEFEDILGYADVICFNTWSQWDRFQPRASQADRPVGCGVRINPEFSEVPVEIYNPCARNSRLGLTLEEFLRVDRVGLSGVLFHSLCGQNSDVLERTLRVVTDRFGPHLSNLQWINFGGGHHITRADYDVDLLCRLIVEFRDRYDVQVYLEPGEAVALNTGILVATVLDILHNDGFQIAILDTSATAHMPDVLEMPYRPDVFGAGKPDEQPYTYRLGGISCLAGDVIGDYSFPEPLHVGSRLAFLDMAHYTMVKNTTFNGVGLPSIGVYDPEKDRVRLVREFGYDDYKRRLS